MLGVSRGRSRSAGCVRQHTIYTLKKLVSSTNLINIMYIVYSYMIQFTFWLADKNDYY